MMLSKEKNFLLSANDIEMERQCLLAVINNQHTFLSPSWELPIQGTHNEITKKNNRVENNKRKCKNACRAAAFPGLARGSAVLSGQ